MSELSALIEGDEDSWIATLPSYQRELIVQLRRSGLTLEETGRQWLEASGAANTSPFGGGTAFKIFYDNFLDQLHDLLCSPDKYQTERRELQEGVGAGKTFVVATISAEIARHLETSPSFIAPTLAVTLVVIAKVGLKTWCELQTERRAKSASLG